MTYFVHGTTTDNEQSISSGWKDIELSELGVQQSKELCHQINLDTFDVVFCSDLKRAVDTAKFAFQADNVPIIKDKRLRECDYGDFNGKPSSIVEPLQEEHITEPFSNGESYENVKTRIQEFLHMLKSEYDVKNLAIIAHKAPQLTLDVLITGKTWWQAFDEDWRKTKSWQLGWNYILP